MPLRNIIFIKLPGAIDSDDSFMIPYDQASYDVWAAQRFPLYGDALTPNSYLAAGETRERAALLPMSALNSAEHGGRQWAIAPEMPNLASMFNTTRDASIVADVGSLIEPEPFDGTSFVKPIPGPLAAHDGQQNYQEAGQGARIAGGVVGRGGFAIAEDTGLTGLLRKQVAFSLAQNFLFGEGPEGAAISVSRNGSVATANTVVELVRQQKPAPANPADQGTQQIFDVAGQAAVAAWLSRTGVSRPSANLLAQTLYDRTVSIQENVVVIRAIFDQAVTVGADTNYEPNATGFRADEINTLIKIFLRQSLFAGQPMVVGMQYGGPWDSHGNQAVELPSGLRTLDGWLAQLRNQFIAAGLWDDTAIMIAGEFGRTTIPNTSGTDHAWAGHAIVLGGMVNGGNIYHGTPEAGQPAGPMVRTPAHPQTYDPRGRYSPRFDWSQVYAAFFQGVGISEAEMATYGLFNNFANLRNYPGTASPIVPCIAAV